MAHIIAIMNFKGGVAKTTTAISLCHALAMNKKNCLLVDLDTQCNATTNLNEGKYMNGENDETIFDTLFDKTMETELPIYTYTDNFDFVPADIQLRDIDVLLSIRRRNEDILKYHLSKIADEYDYIILDCPPGDGIINTNAMSAADHIICPTTGADIHGIYSVMAKINETKKVMELRTDISKIIFTKYDKRTNMDKDAFMLAKNDFPNIVSEHIVPSDINIQYAKKAHKTIFQTKPYSPAGIEYREIAKEIEKMCC